MTPIVIDSSAILAMFKNEPGSEQVISRLDHGIMSAVNFSEVVARVARNGEFPTQVIKDLQHLVRDIRHFDTEQAILAGQLIPQTQAFGLSFGDRACLSLAKALALPVLTADQAWKNITIGVQVELIQNSTIQP
jgi:ribonuclease VapC